MQIKSSKSPPPLNIWHPSNYSAKVSTLIQYYISVQTTLVVVNNFVYTRYTFPIYLRCHPEKY